jgi:aryl-alcohol dehydrogenase-like predicted oxidoreductase
MTPAGRAALAGRATAAGTARYAARHCDGGPPAPHPAHYRQALGLTVSSVGYGTSGGALSDEVDAAYCVAIADVVGCGCNLLDTAPSYRAQRSEAALGRAIAGLVRAGECRRDELVVTSKGGFIPYHLQRPADPTQYVFDTFVRSGIAEPDDFAGGIHCMAPNFLVQQVTWSLRNLGLRALDIYFIQNPEIQLAFVDRTTFRKRMQLAFAALEEEVAAGRVGCYGIATWEGLRRAPISPDYLSLEVLLRLAAEVAGPDHHLRAIQLPVNPAMPEAQTLRNQPVRNRILSVLDAAADLGITVIGSAALGQGALTDRHAAVLSDTFPGLDGLAPRALQFARSLPRVTAALFGSLDPVHLRQTLAVSSVAPDPERALRAAQILAR